MREYDQLVIEILTKASIKAINNRKMNIRNKNLYQIKKKNVEIKQNKIKHKINNNN